MSINVSAFVRQMQPADRDAVIDLKWEMGRYHARLPGNSTSLDDDMDNSREAAAAAIARDLGTIEAKGGALNVAEAAGQVVGYLSWYVDDRARSVTIRPERRPVGYVAGICIAEPYRGQGIGPMLLTHAEQQVRAMGLTRLGIGVGYANSHAHAVYAQFGFKARELLMFKPLD